MLRLEFLPCSVSTTSVFPVQTTTTTKISFPVWPPILVGQKFRFPAKVHQYKSKLDMGAE